jgi:hypothetical protein
VVISYHHLLIQAALFSTDPTYCRYATKQEEEEEMYIGPWQEYAWLRRRQQEQEEEEAKTKKQREKKKKEWQQEAEISISVPSKGVSSPLAARRRRKRDELRPHQPDPSIFIIPSSAKKREREQSPTRKGLRPKQPTHPPSSFSSSMPARQKLTLVAQMKRAYCLERSEGGEEKEEKEEEAEIKEAQEEEEEEEGGDVEELMQWVQALDVDDV